MCRPMWLLPGERRGVVDILGADVGVHRRATWRTSMYTLLNSNAMQCNKLLELICQFGVWWFVRLRGGARV